MDDTFQDTAVPALKSIKKHLWELIAQRKDLELKIERLTTQTQDLSTTLGELQHDYADLAATAGRPKIAATLMRSILLHGFRELPWLFPDKNEDKRAKPKPRSLVKTVGSTVEIQLNKPHRFAANHALCHYASNSICTFIPKNACTSLRYSLALANGAIGGPNDFHWIHANNQAFAASTLKELLQAEYTFIFLRNPFTRLTSYFLDKLAGKPTFASDSSYELARSLFPEPIEDLSFRDTVNILWNNPERIEIDEHIRPQVDFLVYQDYDDWFSLENYNEAIQRIEDRIQFKILDSRKLSLHTTHRLEVATENGMPDKPIREIQCMRSAGLTPCTKDLYDEELAFKTASLYYCDIALYCYHFGRNASITEYLDKCQRFIFS